MSLVASALVPLTLLIALGFALKRSRFLPDTFWPGLDRLNYWVFFPSLIFVALATAERGLAGAGPVGIAVWGGLATVAAIALALRRRLACGGLTALMVALTVPFVNVLSVSVLARYGAGSSLRWRSLLVRIATNPLIVASVLGVAAGRLGLPLGPLESSLRMLGQAALAAGLLSVGATLRFRNVRAGWREVAGSLALKFAALPAASAAIGTALGLAPAVLGPLVLFQAMPTASASYVLARAMRGDEQLMAAILAVHTLAALAWLPLVFALLQATG